ncbi:hypothetical protein G5B30_00845 [Sphingobacterium sp. SGG-5]|nr:hypothetical protein [Sphingobacterium sp. SGG-5]
MKQLLLALVVTTASLLTFTSCTKEYITEQYDMVPSKTMIYERSASQWEPDGTARNYIDLPVNELTQYYINQGIVSVAMSVDDEESYFALPMTYEGIAYSFDYVVGSIRIYAQDPIIDAGVTIDPPANAVFKVSLTDADWVE